MKLDRLVSFFSTNPAARLLRSPHAAPIAYFLHREFKERDEITIGHAELVQRLAEFLDELHASEPECLADRAENYLNDWTSAGVRWLRRYHDAEHAEPVYELTPHTEEVLKFLSHLLERGVGFVGTESRLKRIIDALSDIVVRSSDDPEQRLAHLRAERRRLDEEIAAIESGTGVETYSATAIRERFADAVADLTSLQGDFRAVEESFKAITREVQQRQNDPGAARGEILGQALAAEDRLKFADQGVSFNEFVRLILSPAKQEQLESVVAELQKIDALAEQTGGMQRVRGMISHLADEAEKVLRTTRRLSATLRRLLDVRSNTSRQRVAEVLSQIKTTARNLATNPPGDEVGLRLATQLQLTNPMERTFWTAPTEFDVRELLQHEPDELDRFAAFRHFVALERLDWKRMHQNVESAVEQSGHEVTLPELLEAYPVTTGAIELLGYLQLAHDEGHEVTTDKTHVVHIQTVTGELATYEVPRVVFLARGLRKANVAAGAIQ
ncbi:DUF3375 domain-containing protein [Aeoliella sp.]|uniref:DUF3375 domain-containing protein n=1 Tax=Aeoliella sp. TaxID=2795800 RepID=UPI003CCBF219